MQTAIRMSRILLTMVTITSALGGCLGADTSTDSEDGQATDPTAPTDPTASSDPTTPIDPPASTPTDDGSGAPTIEIHPDSATGCTGNTCIFVNGTGLRVNYATVTNRNGKPVGAAIISSTWDGRTVRGPVLHKNQAWRHDYNRVMNNGNKVCGSIEGIDVACVTIHK